MNLNNEVSPGERVTDENCQRHIRVKAETIENNAPSRERALLFWHSAVESGAMP